MTGDSAPPHLPIHLEWRSDYPLLAGRRLARRLGLGDVELSAIRFADSGGAILSIESSALTRDDQLAFGLRPPLVEPVDVPFALAAVALATIDLAQTRAHGSIEEEPILGARGARLDEDPLVIALEPTTEGRLAASLARFGPGPCGLYLRPLVGASAIAASTARPGILGLTRLVLGGPVWGPQLMLVGAGGDAGRSSTIEV